MGPDETGESRTPRAFWKGSLSFGLIEIPVALRPAVQSDELHFTLLDKRDFTPVGYRRYNRATGNEVAWDDIVRGYEYDRDEYVVLTDEDLKRANVEATGTIEIAHEIRPASKIAAPAAGKQGGVTERELQMAERLIQDMTTGWDPKRYRDEYRDDLMALVHRRVEEGKTRVIASAPAETPSRPVREVMDLMPLLERSLEDRGGARRGERKPARKVPERRRRRSA